MMRDIPERRAVRLGWEEVRGIVSDEIEDILGLQIQCRINVVEGSFWDATFIGQRSPSSVSSYRRHRPHRRTGKMPCPMREAWMSTASESGWLKS